MKSTITAVLITVAIVITPAFATGGMGGMGREAMEKQGRKMGHMMEQMQKTENPDDRMKMMHEHMAMMMEMRDMMKNTGKGPNKNMKMDERMQHMSERMGMMQMMMDNMLDQQKMMMEMK